MAHESFFNATVSGEETIQQDLNEHLLKINDASHSALVFLGGEMTRSLQHHIYMDWYLPWGMPKKYQRRSNNNSLGTPLSDLSNIDSDVKGLSLRFAYHPTGDHSEKKWHKRDGDALIEVIQKNTGWTWKPNLDQSGRKIKPRPFWDNFVEEEKNGGIWDGFFATFGGREYTLTPEGGERDVSFDSKDGQLSQSERSED